MRTFPLILALFVTLCSPSHAQTPHKITLCLTPHVSAMHFYTAKEQGFFAAQGLDVEFMSVSNGKLCNDAAIAGHADITMGSEAAFTFASFGDNPLRILATIGSNSETTLVVREESGIRNAKDLRSKRIGYLPASSSYFYLVRLLDNIGLSMKDVTLTALQPPAMPKALEGGAIDAFVMWEPWVHQTLKNMGGKAVDLRDTSIYKANMIMTANKDFLEQHPEDAKALLLAMLEAENFVIKHPDTTIALMADVTKLDAQVLQKSWQDYGASIRFDEDILKKLEDNARYVIRDDPNFADKIVPDFRRFIEPKFLRKVAPERVTIR